MLKIEKRNMNKLLLSLLTFVLLLVLGCDYFIKEKCEPEQALVGDAVVVVFSKDGAWISQFMGTEFPLFPSKEGGFIFSDSVEQQAEIGSEIKLIFGKKYFLSMYEREGVSVSLLAFELQETRERKVVDFIKKITGKTGDIPFQTYKNTRCYTIEREQNVCYFAIKDAALLASASLPLLQEAIDNLSNGGSLCHNEQYCHATQLWGRNVVANIYIAYHQATVCLNPTFHPIFKDLEDMALWSSFDVSKKENIWILNGYTALFARTFLNSDIPQQSVRMDATEWLSAGNTGYYYAIEPPSDTVTLGISTTSALKKTLLYSQIFPLMDETCHLALYCHHLGKQALSVQLSAADDLFYSRFIVASSGDKPLSVAAQEQVKYIEDEVDTVENDGKIVLDGNMILSPSVFLDPTSKKLNVFVFDDQNNLYLIEKERGIIFKKPLDDLPLSRVYEMEAEQGEGKKYIFNSKNRLYVIDSKGNDAQGFPLELAAPAQNPIAVFDFQKKKDYSIVWIDATGVVQCVDKAGKKRQGWTSPAVSGNVSKEVQYCSKGAVSYLIAALDNGNVILYDRQGKVKMTVKSSFHNNPRTDFYINETNYQKGLLLTTDKIGTLVYLPEKGKISTTVFGTFSEQHQFLYGDWDNDGHYDFIYLDKNELKVFNRFKKQIFKHTFPKSIASGMKLFTLDKKKYLVVSAVEDGTIYLLDNKGIQSFLEGLNPI